MVKNKANNDKDVALRDQAELPDELRKVFELKANMEGVVPRLPQIKIAHQETQLFIFPDENQVKTFEGIIIDTNRINAWWEISYDDSGGGTPPDCFSMDGIECNQNGNMPQAKLCRDCEKNQFGSESKRDGQKGRGKACKNMKRVHIIMEGEMLPLRMTLPPSSLKLIDDYISRLTSKGLPYQLTTTIFGLTKEKNKDGINYSGIKLEKGELITDPERALSLKKLYAELKPIMRGQEIISSEYGDTE